MLTSCAGNGTFGNVFYAVSERQPSADALPAGQLVVKKMQVTSMDRLEAQALKVERPGNVELTKPRGDAVTAAATAANGGPARECAASSGQPRFKITCPDLVASREVTLSCELRKAVSLFRLAKLVKQWSLACSCTQGTHELTGFSWLLNQIVLSLLCRCLTRMLTTSPQRCQWCRRC